MGLGCPAPPQARRPSGTLRSHPELDGLPLGVPVGVFWEGEEHRASHRAPTMFPKGSRPESAIGKVGRPRLGAAMLTAGWSFDTNRLASQELARRPVLKAYAKGRIQCPCIRRYCGCPARCYSARWPLVEQMRKPNQLHKAKHRHWDLRSSNTPPSSPVGRCRHRAQRVAETRTLWSACTRPPSTSTTHKWPCRCSSPKRSWLPMKKGRPADELFLCLLIPRSNPIRLSAWTAP